MDKRIEEFLDRAAEGLRDDTELQLDARAELAAHAEDKLQDLEQEGLPAEEAIQQTVKALGEPIDIATDLYNTCRCTQKPESDSPASLTAPGSVRPSTIPV